MRSLLLFVTNLIYNNGALVQIANVIVCKRADVFKLSQLFGQKYVMQLIKQ